MNRLIIVGNGFDIAHGLETSFNSFISDYFFNAFKQFYTAAGSYKDVLLELNVNPMYPNSYKPLHKELTIEDISKHIEKAKEYITIKFHSKLLQTLHIKGLNQTWVDIEIEFFKALVKANNSRGNRNDDINNINTEFSFIKKKLIEYLKRKYETFENKSDLEPLVDTFTENFNPKEIIGCNLSDKLQPEKLFFLNFNYTDTILKYSMACRNYIKTNVNFIHGKLYSESSNQPIFGFGDELNEEYKKFEDSEKDELFEHIKSFDYLKNQNYHNLLNFLQEQEYQVQIYGHSCGLSDRTMLNEIFESENCKSIKIFYHEKENGENDFIEKTYNIYKHFKDKSLLRKKILPFDLSQAMPQPK